MIIALDGPAGSGKSTIAREVAKRLGLRYLDTGAMYRAVTLLALEEGLIPDGLAEAGALAAATPLRLEHRENELTRVFVGEREITHEIRGRLVSQHVSAVSAHPAVRAVLTQKQREEAVRGNVVLEGRDIGTVVVPHADVKVFLTACIEERARRRRLQLESLGLAESLDEVIADMATRDAYDSSRPLAPLCKAADAVEIDTTHMTIDEVVAAVCALAAQKAGETPPPPPTGTCSQGPAAQTQKPPPVSDPPEAGTASGRPATPAVSHLPLDPRWGTRWPLCRMIRSPLDTLAYRFLYSFVPPTVHFFYRMKITGAENVPVTGPVVLASNHRSNLDPFFLGVSCPRMIHFMAKVELWRFKPLGWIIGKLGAFPVKRGAADRGAVRQALEVLRAGAVLGLFPEGRRERERDLGEIQPGVTMFSLSEGVTTIPVVMRGTDRVVKNHLLHFPRVRVAFGPAVEVPGKELPRSQRAVVTADRLTKAFRDLLAATSGEV